MAKTIAIHSYKGGTGKSSIAGNIAAKLAKDGENVCILDFDFRAPSLNILFKTNTKKWLNDFLEGKCEVNEVIIDLRDRLKTKGDLYLGLANPAYEAMKEMMTKDRKWEMNALHRTLSAKTVIYSKMKVDYLIFDTSPGVHYSSINALAGSDVIALVMKPDEYDLEGTKEMVRGIYEVLGKKTGLILNKITPELLSMEGGLDRLQKRLANALELPIIGTITWKNDVLAQGGKLIHVLEKPEHEFSKAIGAICDNLARF